MSKTPQRPAFVSSAAHLTVRKCPFYMTNQLKAQLKLSTVHDDIVHITYSYTGFVEVPVVKTHRMQNVCKLIPESHPKPVTLHRHHAVCGFVSLLFAYKSTSLENKRARSSDFLSLLAATSDSETLLRTAVRYTCSATHLALGHTGTA